MAKGKWEAAHKSVKQDYGTPSALIAYVERHMICHSFNLDACALPETAVADRYFTPEDDGLTTPWFDDPKTRYVWCNPEYQRGNVIRWLDRGIQQLHEADLHAPTPHLFYLLYARTSGEWWHKHAMSATAIYFLKGRLKFVGEENGAPAPSAILHFSRSHPVAPKTAPWITNLDWRGRVPPFEEWRPSLQQRARRLGEEVE